MDRSDPRSLAGALRKALPAEVFLPATSRLLWIPLHVAVVLGLTLLAKHGLTSGWSAWFLLPASVAIGLSFAGLAFVAHEALHGALTRRRGLRKLAGWLGFLPFCVPPRLWIMWHNSVHHGAANVPGRDPDAYPTLDEYRTSRGARLAVDLGAPRTRKWRGIITFLFGFSLQAFQVLVWSRARRQLSTKHYVLAWVEALIALGIWLALGAWIGPLGFLLVYVLPLVVGNVVVMAHIVTNHSLSPLADENDPLTTTLTVTVPRWFSFYTLGFGYHVEHHLFPSMSHRHGPLVAQHLRHMAPDRYQEMPLLAALRLMFSTPRVYENHTTLYDPATGERAPALGSRPVFIPLAGDVEEFDRGRRRSRAAVPALSDPDPRGEWQWLSGAMPDGPRHSSIPPPPPA